MDKIKRPPFKIKIIIYAVILIIFTVFGTLLVDLLLIKLYIPPFFSNIVSDKSESGEVIVGKGLIYTTLERKIDTADGKIWGAALYLGYDKRIYTEDIISKIPMKYYSSDGKSYVLEKETEPDGEIITNNGEEIEIEDEIIFNMDTIRSLADGEIGFKDFIAKFPGNETTAEDGSSLYHIDLPNEYSVEISYSGETLNFMRLYDKQIGQYIDLISQNIDMFLLERQ